MAICNNKNCPIALKLPKYVQKYFPSLKLVLHLGAKDYQCASRCPFYNFGRNCRLSWLYKILHNLIKILFIKFVNCNSICRTCNSLKPCAYILIHKYDIQIRLRTSRRARRRRKDIDDRRLMPERRNDMHDYCCPPAQ